MGAAPPRGPPARRSCRPSCSCSSAPSTRGPHRPPRRPPRLQGAILLRRTTACERAEHSRPSSKTTPPSRETRPRPRCSWRSNRARPLRLGARRRRWACSCAGFPRLPSPSSRTRCTSPLAPRPLLRMPRKHSFTGCRWCTTSSSTGSCSLCAACCARTRRCSTARPLCARRWPMRSPPRAQASSPRSIRTSAPRPWRRCPRSRSLPS
mmetsp:Transcript_24883/g.53689  ORF Transcript_24883/g.53689 Transcript_24883/m.53689 type:complete len:208 (-) Transcript_24883:653-1276(-)